MKNIELVIFDCDGVLVDTEKLANRVFIEEVTKFGFHITAEEAWEHFPGSRFADCVAYVEHTNQRKLPVEFTEIYREKSAQVFALEMEAIPGILHLLSHLALPKAVASNGPKATIIANLHSCRLHHFFDERHIFSAYEVQKWKPEPDLHLNVSKVMGIDPAHCVVIEDSVPGIQGALNAKMKVIGFSHAGRNQKIMNLDIPIVDHLERIFDLLPDHAKMAYPLSL